MKKENVVRVKLYVSYFIFLIVLFLLIFNLSCKQDLSDTTPINGTIKNQFEDEIVSSDIEREAFYELKLNLKHMKRPDYYCKANYMVALMDIKLI